MPWLNSPCANCTWWDTHLGNEETSRLHKAMDHVKKTRNGMRLMDDYTLADLPDRYMSASQSASVAIGRLSQGGYLHRITLDRRGDATDLRWLIHEAPHLDHQCRACHLPQDDAWYCRNWGIWLQEILVDRCNVHPRSARSTYIAAESMPLWVTDLAWQVADVYRREDRVDGRFKMADVWACVQEFRLTLYLLRLL